MPGDSVSKPTVHNIAETVLTGDINSAENWENASGEETSSGQDQDHGMVEMMCFPW